MQSPWTRHRGRRSPLSAYPVDLAIQRLGSLFLLSQGFLLAFLARLSIRHDGGKAGFQPIDGSVADAQAGFGCRILVPQVFDGANVMLVEHPCA